MAQIFFRSWRNSIDPYPSLASLPEDEANGNFCSGVSTAHCDTDVEIVPDTFDEGDVPHKKRHCLGTIETDRGGSVEPLLNLVDACIVCEISDKRVSRCSGSDCLLSFHGECLYAAESGSSSEHLANPYCPYCRLKILSMKSKTLREKTVSAEKAAFKYLDKEMKSRDEDTTLSVDKNGNQEHSVDGTDIVSDQEVQGKKDDCSSKEEHVQVDDASHPSFLFSLAEKFGYSEWIQFDASVVRGLAYYTGIVFERFDRKGKLRAICGGGRYDRLLSTYGGDDIPACGFGFGDAVIVELLKEKDLLPTGTRRVHAV